MNAENLWNDYTVEAAMAKLSRTAPTGQGDGRRARCLADRRPRLPVRSDGAGRGGAGGARKLGGPAWEPGQTWLYLSGDRAQAIADCFAAGPLETTVIGQAIGKASALKMSYAAWTKGSTALLSAILATAEALGVWEDLARQWERNWPGFAEQSVNRARRVTAKAWRFAGEMDEISATFQAAGLPGSFHAAAGELYRRMAGFKDAPETPTLEEVLAALLEPGAAAE